MVWSSHTGGREMRTSLMPPYHYRSQNYARKTMVPFKKKIVGPISYNQFEKTKQDELSSSITNHLPHNKTYARRKGRLLCKAKSRFGTTIQIVIVHEKESGYSSISFFRITINKLICVFNSRDFAMTPCIGPCNSSPSTTSD